MSFRQATQEDFAAGKLAMRLLDSVAYPTGVFGTERFNNKFLVYRIVGNFRIYEIFKIHRILNGVAEHGNYGYSFLKELAVVKDKQDIKNWEIYRGIWDEIASKTPYVDNNARRSAAWDDLVTDRSNEMFLKIMKEVCINKVLIEKIN